MKRFKHLGKMGDIIYSLPTIKALGGGVLYIPERTAESPCIYSCMKSLLEQQPYIAEVLEYPSGLGYNEQSPLIRIDYDMDRHRYHPLRGVTHVVKRFLETFNIDLKDWEKPWLTVIGQQLEPSPYILFNVTSRFRDNSKVDWKKVVDEVAKLGIPMYHVGSDDESDVFYKNYGQIPRMVVDNALDLAILVRDAKRIYCNQSLVLTLAQGLGKQYWCEFKPNKTNCRLYTENEHAL